MSFTQYHNGLSDQSLSTDQMYYNIMDSQTLLFYLTLKMASAQVIITSDNNHTSFQNYPHPDNHTGCTT